MSKNSRQTLGNEDATFPFVGDRPRGTIRQSIPSQTGDIEKPIFRERSRFAVRLR